MGSAEKGRKRWFGACSSRTHLVLLLMEGFRPQDILPLLSAPSPALALHADHALATLTGPQPRQPTTFEVPALAQYRALVYAARWETGIDRQEFLGPVLEGERWLVKAASSVRYEHPEWLEHPRNTC